MTTASFLLRYLGGDPHDSSTTNAFGGYRSAFEQLFTPVQYHGDSAPPDFREWDYCGMKFIEFEDPTLYIVLRQDDEIFTDSAIAQDQPNTTDFTINGQIFDGYYSGKGSYIFQCGLMIEAGFLRNDEISKINSSLLGSHLTKRSI